MDERWRAFKPGVSMSWGTPVRHLRETTPITSNTARSLEKEVRHNGKVVALPPLAMNSSMSALSVSPDQSRLIVAGRDVLKIIKVADSGDELTVSSNLRIGKVTMTLNSNDVAWHPLYSCQNKIATGATNAHVVLWDLNRSVEQKQEMVITGHTRTINCVAWLPTEQFSLLSGSQDNTVKLWDTRATESAAAVFKTNSPVRQVSCSKLTSHHFATALDDGAIQVWDIRNPSSFPFRIPAAHEGPAYSVEWHPTERGRLASGGRDKSIRIWDTLSNTSDRNDKLFCTVKTLAAVARVCWRPEHAHHVTSYSLVHDSNIHVWDLRRKHLPVLSFQQHKNVVTGMVWDTMGEKFLFSCSKDEKVIRNNVEDAHCPGEDAEQRSSGISWNPMGGLSHFKSQHLNVRSQGGYSLPPTILLQNMYQSSILSELCIVRPTKPSTTLVDCAKRYKYRLHDGGVNEVCLYNACVCDDMLELELAQAWRVIGELWDSRETNNSEAASSSKPDLDVKNKQNPTKDDNTVSEKDDAPISMFQSEIEGLTFGTGLLTEFTNEATTATKTPTSVRKEVIPERYLLHSDDDDDDDNDDQSDDLRHGLHRNISGVGGVGVGVGVGGVGVVGVGDVGGGGDAGGDVGGGDNEELLTSTTHDIENDPSSPRAAMNGKAHNKDTGAAFDAMANNVDLSWDLSSIISDTLTFYGDHGDVQTCVALMLVLGEASTKDIAVARQLDWYYAYCELLERMKLYEARAEVIGLAHLGEISELSLESTNFHLGCGGCQKPIPKVGWYCNEKCRKLIGKCAICHLPVKTVYSWCQGCGHGGHSEHMREWFQTNKLCPTGCGHSCEFD